METVEEEKKEKTASNIEIKKTGSEKEEMTQSVRMSEQVSITKEMADSAKKEAEARSNNRSS